MKLFKDNDVSFRYLLELDKKVIIIFWESDPHLSVLNNLDNYPWIKEIKL